MWFEIFEFFERTQAWVQPNEKRPLIPSATRKKRPINADFRSGKTCILDTGRNVFFLANPNLFPSHTVHPFFNSFSHLTVSFLRRFFPVRSFVRCISLWLSIFFLLFCAQSPINFAFSKNVLAHWICVWSFLAFVQCVCSRSAVAATAAAAAAVAGPERNLCAQKVSVSVCVLGAIFEASKIRLGNGIFGLTKSFSLLYMQTHLLWFYSDMAAHEGHRKIHCRSCMPIHQMRHTSHTHTHIPMADGWCLVACVSLGTLRAPRSTQLHVRAALPNNKNSFLLHGIRTIGLVCVLWVNECAVFFVFFDKWSWIRIANSKWTPKRWW